MLILTPEAKRLDTNWQQHRGAGVNAHLQGEREDWD